MNTKRLTKLIALVLALVMCTAVLTACPKPQPEPEPTPEVETPDVWEDDGKNYTYNTYTGVSPSNWNELTYQDSNDTQIMSYIGSSFFSYDFKFDSNGNIMPGEFVVTYEAATKLEDVTAEYAEAWGLDASKTGFAYRITLRDNLKWENGDKITAHDFVYTMSEQLSPLFLNYRADSFYAGATIIVNAQNYLKQGQHYDVIDNGDETIFLLSDLVKGDDGVYRRHDGGDIFFPLTESLSWCSGYSIAQLAAWGYFDYEAYQGLEALADDNGNVAITDESIALVETLICTPDWGMEGPENVPYYMMTLDYTFPAMDFSQVGLFAESDTELVIVLAKALPLLKEDGSLAYQAAYNMSSLPLVHRETYEANKEAPAEGSTLWTSTYNSSVDSTMSWGPYKLTTFQSGKVYILERNTEWYGYDNSTANAGLYQVDTIFCETIGEWNTAWLKFLAGEIDGIGIDPSVAADYKGSSQAYFTPEDYVGSMQLQSNYDALKGRETEGVNKTMLAYAEFRKALSLSVDRVAYTQTCTTASFAGFGLFNSMHYYDVENGGAYRNSDEAKKVLCEVYGVDWTKFDNIDDAVEQVTGYNLTLARELLTTAYNKAVEAGDIDGDDVVLLTFGTSVINESTQRNTNFLKNAFQAMAVGTPLEGRIDVEIKDFGSTWANSFRSGAYDICQGGWQGAAWDPGYFLLAYLDPNYMYSQAWDTSSHMMEFTMVGVGEDGGDVTETMSLMDWYACLNGYGKYDWSANALEQEQRLQLIAALEKEILSQYYTVPMYNYFAASLISYKCDYVTYDYNTFMGYGGIKYMQFNYTDEEWAAEIEANGGEFDYTR